MVTLTNGLMNWAHAMPLFTLVFSVTLFVVTCLANWHPAVRKKVNYWLSFGEKDERQAYATAEERLYNLNGFAVMVSGLLFITSLFMLGLIK